MRSLSLLRDYLYRLDPQDPAVTAPYEQALYQFIALNEGVCPQAYVDTAGKMTVGVGFNMADPAARAQWQEAFGASISFEAVWEKQRVLSPGEIWLLYQTSRQTRKEEVERLYQVIWPQLRLNERLAMEDAYYNGPSLVRRGTQFYQHMHEYVRGRQEGLLQAVRELTERSNPRQHHGIQQRRHRQGEMLASYKCPDYQLVKVS